MAGLYTLELITKISEKESDKNIQSYIDRIKAKVKTDESAQIKISVTPEIQYDKNLKERVSTGRDIVSVQAEYNNQLGQSIRESGKFVVVEGEIAKTLKTTNEYTDKAASSQRNLATEMSAVIRRTLESALTLGLLYGALNQLRQGIQYIKDLDKELTNIQVVTGMSEENVQKLALGYNKLAERMGATTLEVSKGSVEWLRQGKTAAETEKLLESTMMLSKLGAMESAEATERLTSILNGFKLEAEDASMVVDKLIKLDNSFATSSNEIATAMQYSANSARQAGVSYEELAAYITVISSVTRKSSKEYVKLDRLAEWSIGI